MLRVAIPRDEGGDPVRLFVATVASIGLGWALLAVHEAGRISLRAGPRLARGTFEADRVNDPAQFYGALAVIGFMFLLALAAAASSLWDIVVAARRGSEPGS
jgi:hypothetical protein